MCQKCKQYIGFWDQVIRDWFHLGGNIPPSQAHWSGIVKNIQHELMPEPYWGNPEECSVVLINYNPGASKIVSLDDPCHYTQVVANTPNTKVGVMHACYSEYALPFPWLDNPPSEFCASCSHAGTLVWMQQRAQWVNRVCNIQAPLSEYPRPFFMDICGWHSYKWNGNIQKVSPNVLQSLNDIISAAISHSIQKIGLCVGKGFISLLSRLGYQDVTQMVTGQVVYQPISGISRWYKVFCKDGIRIICTWSRGSNRQPSARFAAYEQQLLAMTKILIC